MASIPNQLSNQFVEQGCQPQQQDGADENLQAVMQQEDHLNAVMQQEEEEEAQAEEAGADDDGEPKQKRRGRPQSSASKPLCGAAGLLECNGPFD